MNDKFEENPEIAAGIAMSLARERAALREKAGKAVEGSESSGSGAVVTALVVVALLVGTLALMLFLGK